MDSFNNSKPKKMKIQDLNIQKKIQEFPWGKVHNGNTKDSNKKTVSIRHIKKEYAIQTKQVDLLWKEIKFFGYLMNPFIVIKFQ